MASDDGYGFSSLPDPIIHHILSHLPCRDVVRVTAVCKSWAQAVNCFPILEFDTNAFLTQGKVRGEVDGCDLNSKPDIDLFYTSGHMEQRLSRMSDFVDATMTRFRDQRLSIEKFKLNYTEKFNRENWVNRLDRWIGIAIENHVREISVRFKYDHVYWHPSRILWAPFVQSLEFSNIELLPIPPHVNVPINLDSLKSITMEGVSVNQETLDMFVSSCRKLEFLSLEFADLFRRTYSLKMRISGLPNIKKVKVPASNAFRLPFQIHNPIPVEIEAPSLESLYYGGIFGRIPPPALIIVNHSPNLKKLELSKIDFSNKWIWPEWHGKNWLQEFLSRFPLLEDLRISELERLRWIEISHSSSIRRLDISHYEGLVSIKLETPELKQFQFHSDTIRELPYISLKNPLPPGPGSCECHASISLQSKGVPQWNELKDFIAGARKCFANVTFDITLKALVS